MALANGDFTIEEARELKAISNDLIKYCDDSNIPKGISPENHPEMITPLKSTGYYQKNEEEKIQVEVEKLKNYIKAEEYHQDYLKKIPNGYCHVNLSDRPDFN